jgi:hypothetical protein
MDPSTLTLEAVGAALAAFFALVLRMAIRFALSAEGRAVLRVLRESGVKAALRARAAFADALKRARSADSDGGEEVTPQERKEMAKQASRAFMDELDVLGVLERVAQAFGGVERLEAELIKRVEEKMKQKA